MTAYEAYQIYVAIHLHFNNDRYDYFFYNGHVKNATVRAYEKRQDRYFFEYITANSVVLNKTDMETKLAVYHHLSRETQHMRGFFEWVKNLKSCEYYWKYDQFCINPVTAVEQDLNNIPPDKKFFHPLYIFKFYIERKILLETFLFLDDVLKIVKTLRKDYNPVMEEELRFIKKYYPFSSINTLDSSKMDDIRRVCLKFLKKQKEFLEAKV